MELFTLTLGFHQLLYIICILHFNVPNALPQEPNCIFKLLWIGIPVLKVFHLLQAWKIQTRDSILGFTSLPTGVVIVTFCVRTRLILIQCTRIVPSFSCSFYNVFHFKLFLIIVHIRDSKQTMESVFSDKCLEFVNFIESFCQIQLNFFLFQ